MSLKHILAAQAENKEVVIAQVPVEHIECVSDLSVTAELELAELNATLAEAETVEATLEGYSAELKAVEAGDSVIVAKVIAKYETLMEAYPEACPEIIIASMEGADDLNMDEVEVAMEGINDSSSRLKTAILAIIRGIKKAVAKFFKQYFTIIGRLESNIGKIEVMVKDAEGTPKEKEITFGSMRFLFSNGELADFGATKDIFKDVIASGKDIVALIQAAEKAIVADPKDADFLAITKLWDNALESAWKDSKEIPEATGKQLVSGKFGKYVLGPILPGNQAILTTYDVKGLRSAGATVVTLPTLKAAPEKIEALGLKELSSEIKEAGIILGVTKGIEGSAKAVDKATESYAKVISKQGKKEGVSVIERKFLTFVNGVVSSYLQGVLKTHAKASVQNANAKAMYVKASLANLEVKKAKKKEEDKK